MNFLRFIHTVRSFQPDQIRQKVVYSLAKSKAATSLKRFTPCPTADIRALHPTVLVPICKTYDKGQFRFLNSPMTFDGMPHWNEMNHGKLWNIRLNSFEFLLQKDLSQEDGICLMKDFVKHSAGNRTLYDAYSVSQRIFNWTSFFSTHSVSEQELLDFIYKQAQYLVANPEYHLRNNHLLENGFALLKAGLFFQDDRCIRVGEKILSVELEKQVLYDGAHFELSPMYHCVILRRTLESLDFLRQHPEATNDKFFEFLKSKASVMCGWLRNIAFDNGELPQINDSGDEMRNWISLFQYAQCLGVVCKPKQLGPSGLKKFRNRHFEMLVDMNGLTPAVAPGHSHADTFHFLLHVFGSPFIIDTGVSTYTSGIDRTYERSTQAHNTVVVANKDQSEVYGSFRVGRKASVFNLKESRNEVSASHNGYKILGAVHHRTFSFGEQEIVIKDIINPGAGLPASAFFHVHKNSMLRLKDGKLFSKFVEIGFEGAASIQLSDTWTSPSFGVKLPAWKVRVDFSGELTTRIQLPSSFSESNKRHNPAFYA
ncbi:MAG: alginate lyase family protein [Bacteroidia bacterium]|nr:alginate lyase family protein [Bacteroidia bacterium]